MKAGAPGGSFGAQLKALRDAAGFTQEEPELRSAIEALAKRARATRAHYPSACRSMSSDGYFAR